MPSLALRLQDVLPWGGQRESCWPRLGRSPQQRAYIFLAAFHPDFASLCLIERVICSFRQVFEASRVLFSMKKKK